MLRDLIVGPHQISFDITNKCNLRCLHCYNSSGENLASQNELTDQEVLDFIDEFKSIKLLNFCFCGGEPLLRKELFVEAAKRLRTYGCENVAMVSNGILMTDEVIEELINAGVTRIQISLDGIKAESHDRIRNKKGVYEKATRAIEALVKHGVDTAVAFTPTSFNISELRAVRDYLHTVGISGTSLRVQPLMIMGRASQNVKAIEATNDQYRDLVMEIRKMNMEGKDPQIDWGDPIDHLIRFRQKDLMLTNAIVRSNGELIVDPYLPIILGNLKKHSFTEYWENGLYKMWQLEIVKKLAEKVICIREMDIESNDMPVEFKNGDVYIDLIEDDVNVLSERLLEFFK